LGLFDRRWVALERVDSGSILPISHAEWEHHYGPKKSVQLADETRELLRAYLAMKEQPIVAEPVLQRYAAEYFRVREETTERMKASPGRAEEFGMLVAMMYETFERVAEMRPGQNPFADLDAEAFIKLPDYLYGKETSFGWPLLIGRVIAECEKNFGWKRPAAKVDRRTWGAITGLGFLLARHNGWAR
jgi:hypothetical protein